jgi:hypothetical protein
LLDGIGFASFSRFAGDKAAKNRRATVKQDLTMADKASPAKKRPAKFVFELQLSATDLADFERAADRAVMNLAAWMRDRLAVCAERENRRN